MLLIDCLQFRTYAVGVLCLRQSGTVRSLVWVFVICTENHTEMMSTLLLQARKPAVATQNNVYPLTLKYHCTPNSENALTFMG